MIELPGWSSGSRISPIPQRGPDPSQRMSLATLVRLTAAERSAPDASTSPSRAASASNRFGAWRSGTPISSPMLRMIFGRELGRRVDPGAHGRAAERQLRHRRQRGARRGARCCSHLRVARELLAEPDRHRVLQVGAPDLHDVVERLAPSRPARACSASQRREQLALERLRGGDVDGRGEDVVRRLPHVDVVVGVDRLLAAASPPRISLARFAITSLVFMLVDVPDPVWKMSTTNSPSCCPSATSWAACTIASASFASSLPLVAFTCGGGLLDQRQRADHAAGEAQPADREVLGGPLRLRAVKRVLRDFDLAHRVGLRCGNSGFDIYDSSNRTSSVRSSAPASRRAPDSSAVVLRSRSASTWTKPTAAWSTAPAPCG